MTLRINWKKHLAPTNHVIMRDMKDTIRNLQIQSHHISYEPEEIIDVFKGEHLVLTLIGRQKTFSEQFGKELVKLGSLIMDDGVAPSTMSAFHAVQIIMRRIKMCEKRSQKRLKVRKKKK